MRRRGALLGGEARAGRSGQPSAVALPCRLIIPFALLACLILPGCDVTFGEDEATTVTEAAPTVTEREVIKRRPAPSPPETTTPESGSQLGGTLEEAVATVEGEGYDVSNTDTYDPSYDLRVLIGISQDSATAYAQRAFFFLGGEYLGNDTSADSAGIEYAGQDSNTVSLDYVLYRRNDANCCPSGGKATVRYDWNGSELVPLDEIPPDSLDARLSRR